MLALPWYQRQAKIFPSQTDTNQHPYEYWCKKFSAECYQTKFHSIRVMLPWPSGIRSGTQGQLSATTSMWYATLTEPRGKPTKCSSQIDVQNALDKTHHPLVIKSAQKTENRRWPLPQPHKGPLGQAGGWVHSLVESFPLRWGMLRLPTRYFIHHSGGSGLSRGARKRRGRGSGLKGRSKILSVCRWHDLYAENPNKSTENVRSHKQVQYTKIFNFCTFQQQTIWGRN